MRSPENAKPLPRIENLVLIGLFLFAIALPLVQQLTHPEQKTATAEARRLVARPRLELDPVSLDTFPSRFDAYFADHFGFRTEMLRIGVLFKSRWLGLSASPDVVIGKQGWLYFAGEKSFDNFRGIRQFSPAELEAWRRALERRSSWLAEHGARYLLVLAPDKQTIYPEFVPDRYTRVRERTPLSQLVEYIAAHSKVEIVDPRPGLFAAKAHDRLYYQGDSHWNTSGAFVACQQIITQLHASFSALQPLSRSALKSVPREFEGDLARIAGLGTTEKLLELAVANPKASRPHTVLTPGFDWRDSPRPVATELMDERQLPRAIMVHDSFAYSLMPIVSEHFSRIVFLRRARFNDPAFEKMLAAMVEKEHPEIFIEQITERLIVTVPKEDLLFGPGAPSPTPSAVPSQSASVAPRPPAQTRGPIPPHAAYSLAWLGHDVPPVMHTRATATVHIRIKNTGDWTWNDPKSADPLTSDGRYAVRLAYQWVGPDQKALPGSGARADLRSTVLPGEVADFEVALAAPSPPGDYQLRIDLVEELVTWFSGKGAPKLEIPVTVE